MKKTLSRVWNSGPTLIISAAILWALDGIIRRSLYTLAPIIVVFYAHLIGGIILAPVVFSQLTRHKLNRQAWWLIIIIALLSGVLGTLFFTTALFRINFIPFSVVFLLQKLQPLFAISASAWLLKEKITKQYLSWAGLALVAAYFVTFPNGVVNFATGSGTIAAALYALGAAVAWGSSTAFSKMLLLKIPHDLATGLRFLVTTVFALITVFILGQSAALLTVSLSQLARFLFIALSTGMVALLIYYRGLKLTQVKISTILELVFPLLAVLIEIFLYKKFLAPSQYLAAIVLMYTIYRVSNLKEKRVKLN